MHHGRLARRTHIASTHMADACLTRTWRTRWSQVRNEIKKRVEELERLDRIINSREDEARADAGLPAHGSGVTLMQHAGLEPMPGQQGQGRPGSGR